MSKIKPYIPIQIANVILVLVCLVILNGCASNSNKTHSGLSAGETGPDGTVVYYVPIESNEPGARIVVNGNDVGVTPMTLKINGDKDGTFHNFGSYNFIVRAHPPGEDRPSVTKVYHTGALFAEEDDIPERIYFEFTDNN